MTTLPEIALAFCREVMGWEAEYSHGSITRSNGGAWEHFYFNDLNIVMGAMREWCDRNRAEFRHGITASLNYSSAMAVYKVHIFMDADRADVDAVDPCLALMCACVKAARKLKEKAA